MERTTTKIDAGILNEVKEFTKANGYSLIWFISEAAKEKLKLMKSISKYRKVQSKYVSSMSEYLMKESNKKKK